MAKESQLSFSELLKMDGQFVEADIRDRKGRHFYRVCVPTILYAGDDKGAILQGGVLPGQEKHFGLVQMIVTEGEFTNPKSYVRSATPKEVEGLVFASSIIV